ncbi:MAG TPA: glycoside hydrolase family 172 protein [Candidatus Acidoferrales bacterium]|nr:glycoside hydrolase family 172 protein [Candidatus Acidoferrales bacterium]
MPSFFLFSKISKLLVLAFGFSSVCARAQTWLAPDLGRLTPGDTKAINALWGENPLDVQFKTTKCVVVADLKGPAEITMMHFAYPQHHYSDAVSINRDVRLCIYWDGETNPSVNCPMVDFFCDPNGERDVVNTALVNVRRGFNSYFPMAFRKSAKVELVYDGPLEAGRELQAAMPCYSYVCYRTLKKMPSDEGYFCASWKQEELLLGKNDYVALETAGKGKLIGWNVAIRSLHSNNRPVVDENEKFYIDGETNASVEFQGLEDSFGFSWGFPAEENMFPLTGWFSFHTNGAAAYRFFLQDSISFKKSLKVAIGFGATENGWRRGYSKPITLLQLATTVYWYQANPQVALPPMPPAAERAPAPETFFNPGGTGYSSMDDFKAHGGKLYMCCGYPGGEVIYNEPGYSVSWTGSNEQWSGWSDDTYYCRQNSRELHFGLNLPKSAGGLLRLYIIDPDNYDGGRKETIVVGDKTIGTYDHFQDGRWVEAPVSPAETADGKLSVRIANAQDVANAVISKIEWMEKE